MTPLLDIAKSVAVFVGSAEGQASIALTLGGLLALGHSLEWVVKLTPSRRDDEALAKFDAVLNAALKCLPRLRFGGPK